MTHAYVANPWKKPICDAKLDEGGRKAEQMTDLLAMPCSSPACGGTMARKLGGRPGGHAQRPPAAARPGRVVGIVVALLREAPKVPRA